MEAFTLVCIILGSLYLACGCILGGLVAGVFIHAYCGWTYKRSADSAYNLAFEKAYADHIRKLEADRKKMQAVTGHELNMAKDEAQENFEESLETIYPDDPEIQKILKEKRNVS